MCSGPKLRAVQSCLVCLVSYCDEHLASHRARFTKHMLVDPVRNLEDRMCKKHERLLDLFCKCDQVCVCVLCTKSDHRAHSVVPLDEAVQGFKTQLGNSVAEVQHMFQDRVKKVEEIKQSVELSKGSTERETAASLQIFADLVSFVHSSQAELIEVIEEKQKATERQAEGLIHDLDQEISKLKRRNSELEQLSHTKDYVHFLQSFPSWCTPPCTKDWSDITVHTDECVGTIRTALSQIEETLKKLQRKLSESDLRKAQQNAVEVTLDPSTANRWLLVSEDGKQVRDGANEQDLPDNPERFTDCVCILGTEGFSSGRRYWEVQVGKKTQWDLGVARESVNRKGNIVSAQPQTVGVYVDYEAGQISFYDVEAKAHIYTFNSVFTGKLYPFFSPYLSDGVDNAAPLIISPVGIADC
ncbi:hypothetical protein AAFF_G00358230 [Aldrovandia affinis]|uniref:Uncharacterized protein n=1 Tax=Aldrovandia affinis TaxID=143900 RepID=A0AAD7X174_9TELE|nr:hypothetical protein AAFF_G00358230 [Aldrovandia affinis]